MYGRKRKLRFLPSFLPHLFSLPLPLSLSLSLSLSPSEGKTEEERAKGISAFPGGVRCHVIISSLLPPLTVSLLFSLSLPLFLSSSLPPFQIVNAFSSFSLSLSLSRALFVFSLSLSLSLSKVEGWVDFGGHSSLSNAKAIRSQSIHCCTDEPTREVHTHTHTHAHTH